MVRKRRRFARQMEDVWQQLARQHQARFVHGETWKTDRVYARIDDRTVVLEFRTVPGFKSEEQFTRLRAALPEDETFRCLIHPRNILSKAAAQLGLNSVETEYPELEAGYAIHSNDAGKVQDIIADEYVREVLLDRGDVRIEVSQDSEDPDGPEFRNQLSCEAPGVIDDLEALESLYGVFAQTLACFGSRQEHSSKDRNHPA